MRMTPEELAVAQHVRPVESVDALAHPDTFESDAELADFLTDLYESRQRDQA